MVVTHRNIDKLIDRFIDNGNPYYAIITGSGIHNKNEQESDIENAADRLRRFLNETEGSEATFQIYTYKIVPRGGIKKNSEADTVLTYKAQKFSNEEKEAYRSHRSYFEEKLIDEIQGLKDIVAQQQAILNSQDDEEIENEVEASNPYMGMINGALEHPIINRLIMGAIDKFFPTTNTQPMALAGTEPTHVTIEQILDTLFKKGVTIEHLYKLSQFDQAKIQMLLTML